ncbi:UNVERIFIED_CONTAM: hypothetical protein FKN15_036269 [Acipenser sinensis]
MVNSSNPITKQTTVYSALSAEDFSFMLVTLQFGVNKFNSIITHYYTTFSIRWPKFLCQNWEKMRKKWSQLVLPGHRDGSQKHLFRFSLPKQSPSD